MSFARRLHIALLVASAIVAAIVLARPFRYADPSYSYFDDFFYYLVPAKSFVATGRFTFHPSMTTNGFQPLWMAVIVVLVAVAHGNVMALFAMLNTLIAGLVVWACHEAIAIVREAGGGAIAMIAACLVVLAMQLEIAPSGMEVALATPLLLCFGRRVFRGPVVHRTPRGLAWIGLLGALTVLARLDAAILLAPIAIVIVAREKPTAREIAWIAVGAAPLFVYFVVNRVFGGSFFPISGTAKLLKGPGMPTFLPLEPIVFELGKYAMISPTGFVLLPIFAMLAPAREDARARSLFVAAALGVFAYYATYTVVTDWRLWFWYKYPLAWLGVLACARLSSARIPSWAALATSMALLYVTLRGKRTPETNWIHQHALAIADFARTHPGTYAMGDCAGAVGWILPEPPVQIEGLVGDRAYLELVRARTPLPDVLARYRVDYYAAVGATREGACFALREPSMAGPSSPVMLGRACAEPLFHRDGPLALDLFRAEDVRPETR